MYVYTMTTTEILASALRPGHVLVNFDGETETVTAVEIADGEVFLITTTRSDDLPLGVHAVVTVLTPTAVVEALLRSAGPLKPAQIVRRTGLSWREVWEALSALDTERDTLDGARSLVG